MTSNTIDWFAEKKIPDEDMLALLHIVAYYNNQNPAPQSEPEEAFVEREVSGMVSKEEKKVKPQSVLVTRFLLVCYFSVLDIFSYTTQICLIELA